MPAHTDRDHDSYSLGAHVAILAAAKRHMPPQWLQPRGLFHPHHLSGYSLEAYSVLTTIHVLQPRDLFHPHHHTCAEAMGFQLGWGTCPSHFNHISTTF